MNLIKKKKKIQILFRSNAKTEIIASYSAQSFPFNKNATKASFKGLSIKS